MATFNLERALGTYVRGVVCQPYQNLINCLSTKMLDLDEYNRVPKIDLK